MAYRKFDTQTWQDKRFEKLSPMERYLFIYLWTNDLCNQAGLYEITLRRIEFDTRIPSREVEPLLKGLSGLVEWWSTDEVIFVKNFLKRQCQNKQFAESALGIVLEKFPKYAQVFVKANKNLLEKYGIEPPKIPPEEVQPPLNPPSCSTEAVTEAVTDTDTEKLETSQIHSSDHGSPLGKDPDEVEEDAETHNPGGKRQKTSGINQEALRLARNFSELILKTDPKAKVPKNLDKWAEELDRLIRIDGRDPPEIEAVMVWCQRHPFWSANVLSARKLREKFPQLWIQMRNGECHGKRTGSSGQGAKAHGGDSKRSGFIDANPAGTDWLDGYPGNR